MMGITSLILLIVLVVGTAFLVIKWTNPNKNRHKFSYVKRVQWIFGGYAIILLIGASAASFVPEKMVNLGKKVDMKALEKESSALNVAALEGKIDQLDSKWKRKAWSFDYHEKMLNIADPNDRAGNVMIVAERKSINDDQIEASYYQTRAALNAREITSGTLTPPIDVELDGNQLTIQQKTRKLNDSQFTNVFPIRQFTGEKWFEQDPLFTDGQSILYLQIPKDLHLNPQENLNFEYAVK